MNQDTRRNARKTWFGRQRGKCYLCGKSMVWEECNLDHVIPLSKGGEDKRHNVRVTHIDCNSAKADTEPSPEVLEYLAGCRERAKREGES